MVKYVNNSHLFSSIFQTYRSLLRELADPTVENGVRSELHCHVHEAGRVVEEGHERRGDVIQLTDYDVIMQPSRALRPDDVQLVGCCFLVIFVCWQDKGFLEFVKYSMATTINNLA